MSLKGTPPTQENLHPPVANPRPVWSVDDPNAPDVVQEPTKYLCPWCENVRWTSARKRPKGIDAAQCPNCGCYAPTPEAER